MGHAPPGLPGTLDGGLERLFAGLSSARGRRIFHPQGIVFGARLRVRHGVPGVPLLAAGAEREGIVRFSRALGTPRGRTDFLGLALRLDEQDLLLASSSAAPLTRFAPLPARTFLGTTFTSLLPFTAGTRVVLAGARIAPAPARGGDQLRELADAAEHGPIRIVLALARPLGRWQPVASVELRDRLSGRDVARLDFDPWRCAGGLVPHGRINALRPPAYRGSRRGRAARRSGA